MNLATLEHLYCVIQQIQTQSTVDGTLEMIKLIYTGLCWVLQGVYNDNHVSDQFTHVFYHNMT